MNALACTAAKPARICLGRDLMPIAAERAERRAAPKPAAHGCHASTGRMAVQLAPLGDRSTYPSDEGQT